jgi:putative glycosyltransferase (TIGR04372 family)
VFRIFVHLSPRALGDFVGYAQLAASVRDLFDDAALYVHYVDDRPYKNSIVRCIPNAALTFTSSGGIAVDFFDCNFGRPTHKIKFWEDNRLQDTDLFLSGNMMHELMLNSLPQRKLRPDPKSVVTNDYKLISYGLDKSRWFACVYWKEDGYQFRRYSELRTITNPEPYFATIRHIVENLGGQVVRLGHPTKTVLPQIPGVIDLANLPNSEELQMYAVSRARFLVASASGPAAYGPAFGVPTLNTDQNYALGVWGRNDYILTQKIRRDGKVYVQTDAYDAGLLFMETDQRGLVLEKNSASDLIAGVGEIFGVSKDCVTWRVFSDQPQTGFRPNSITMPMKRRYNRNLLVPPSQRV